MLPIEMMPDDIGITMHVKYDDDGNATVRVVLDPLPAILVRTALSAAEMKLAAGTLSPVEGVKLRGQLSRDGGRVLASFEVPE